MKAFVTRLLDKFWLDYREEVLEEVPLSMYDKIERRLLEKFHGDRWPPEKQKGTWLSMRPESKYCYYYFGLYYNGMESIYKTFDSR